MILLSNMTQFNQMTELWIFVPCPNRVEPPKSWPYLNTLGDIFRENLLHKNFPFSDYFHFACIQLRKYLIAILFTKVSVSGTRKCHLWYIRPYRGNKAHARSHEQLLQEGLARSADKGVQKCGELRPEWHWSEIGHALVGMTATLDSVVGKEDESWWCMVRVWAVYIYFVVDVSGCAGNVERREYYVCMSRRHCQQSCVTTRPFWKYLRGEF